MEEYAYDNFDRKPNHKSYNLLNKVYIRSSTTNYVSKRIYDKFTDVLEFYVGISQYGLFMTIFLTHFYNKFKSYIFFSLKSR